jgi:hypothetical protein
MSVNPRSRMALLLSGMATFAAVVAVAAGCASTDGAGTVPVPAVSSGSARPDTAASPQEICGSTPPTADGSYFCLDRNPSLSPSDLILPSHAD